jgi:hypothetical protein
MGSHAFALGDLSGSAVIGRPLDVSVQIQTGQGEDASAACVSADVYYADARQVAPRISIAAPNAGVSGAVAVRVQSAAVVNEPVITVLMRTSCGSSNMRRYVLLADLPQSAPAPAAVAAASPTFVMPSLKVAAQPDVQLKPMQAATEFSGTVQSQKTSKKRKDKKSKAKIAEPGAATSAESVMQKMVPRTPGKSLLKLDPLEMLSDRIDSLDSTMLFAPTEDALKQTQQISSLLQDMKALRELSAKNEAKLLALKSQLQQAQDQQVPMMLVYGLCALVLACLGAIAWLWRRQSRQPAAPAAWWNDADASSPATVLMPNKPLVNPAVSVKAPVAPETELDERLVVAPVKAPTTVVESSKPEPVVPVKDVELDIDFDHFMLKEPEPVKPKSESSASATVEESPIRFLVSEPVVDIRQQAEFFVSLGQADRALRLLKKQMAESTEPNPFVHLDLMALYHSLGLKADFLESREVFQSLFNVILPEFSAFNQEGQDLESYPDLLADLAAKWPSVKALALLDACIFYNPKAQIRPTFDLAAFRDMLMLHILLENMDLAPSDLAATTIGMVATNVLPVAPSTTPMKPVVASVAEPAQTPSPELELSAEIASLPIQKILPKIEPTKPAKPTRAKPKTKLAETEQEVELGIAASPVDTPQATLVTEPSPTKATPAQESHVLQFEVEVEPAIPDLLEVPEPQEEVSPSRLLDLDFSSLAVSPAKTNPDSEPLLASPVRYATRSRWPVIKKTK